MLLNNKFPLHNIFLWNCLQFSTLFYICRHNQWKFFHHKIAKSQAFLLKKSNITHPDKSLWTFLTSFKGCGSSGRLVGRASRNLICRRAWIASWKILPPKRSSQRSDMSLAQWQCLPGPRGKVILSALWSVNKICPPAPPPWTHVRILERGMKNNSSFC